MHSGYCQSFTVYVASLLYNCQLCERGGTAVTEQQRSSLGRNLRWNNINGVFSTLSQNMLMPFTGIFAIKLGATDTQIAALSAWPALVSLFAMIPSARMVDRFSRKQKLVAGFMFSTASSSCC